MLAFFPGSFNPFHLTHLSIALSAASQFSLSRVYFSLTRISPLKHNRHDIAQAEERLRILEQSIEHHDVLGIDCTELSMDPPYYTIDTVARLRQKYTINEDRLLLIVGADSLLSLADWHRPNDLKQQCTFLVAERPGYDLSVIDCDSFFSDVSWHRIECQPSDTSASDIRGSIRSATDWTERVSPLAESTIKQVYSAYSGTV